MKMLNNAVNSATAFTPAKNYVNLYLKGSMAGEVWSSLEDVERQRRHSSGGIIMCIERTADGDFITSKVGEF